MSTAYESWIKLAEYFEKPDPNRATIIVHEIHKLRIRNPEEAKETIENLEKLIDKLSIVDPIMQIYGIKDLLMLVWIAS